MSSILWISIWGFLGKLFSSLLSVGVDNCFTICLKKVNGIAQKSGLSAFTIKFLARQMAIKEFEGKTITYCAMGSEWRQFGHPKRKRPLKSVVLAPGLSEKIVTDIQDFMLSPQWYADRGELDSVRRATLLLKLWCCKIMVGLKEFRTVEAIYSTVHRAVGSPPLSQLLLDI